MLLFCVNNVAELLNSAVIDLQGHETSLKDHRRRFKEMDDELEILCDLEDRLQLSGTLVFEDIFFERTGLL